jgi:hypothetical protein
LVGNWNRCVDLARGEWVKFLFQDDAIAPACVERMLEAVQASGRPMAVTDREIVLQDVPNATRRHYARYEAEESLASVFPGETELSPGRFCVAVLDHLRQNFVGEPTSVLLHRSAFERFGGFNPNLIAMCDLEFWIRVGVNAGLVRVRQPLATFRVHPRSASATNSTEHEYRTTVLDSLILLHEFAFHPAFAPLRAAAMERRPPMDLRRMFAELAVRAHGQAHMQPGELAMRRAMEEWREVVARYPRVERSFPVMMLQLRRTPRRILRRLARQYLVSG